MIGKFSRFLLVGFITTAVSFCSYIGAERLLRGILESLTLIAVSNLISFIIATAVAFFLNKHFVYISRDYSIKIMRVEAVKFLSVRIFTGLLDIIGVPILAYLLGISGIISKLILGVVICILNFMLGTLVFGKDK